MIGLSPTKLRIGDTVLMCDSETIGVVIALASDDDTYSIRLFHRINQRAIHDSQRGLEKVSNETL